ncbi:MAG TPA: valine--tRNA ligase [Hyphomicrobiales bacterium]|nr:valine--tRNA ligase [Hyphomicrobiales bacterium]
MMEKTYQPGEIEARIADAWDDARAFRAGAGRRPGGESFSVVIPPPNVTGSLHMGHALNNTLQDILVRVARMQGRDVLWQPGMDHAGIATQMVVERQLMERQEPGRREMGREKFVERVWQWKEESGGTIGRQLRRLGASCDWSRERFTMDEGLSRAVRKVFVQLYREGLIYRDKRLVNWDPKLLTAISDLEVQQVEVKGHLWHLRYPIEGKAFDAADPSTYIVVATTRPETMLGDTAVAVNPKDERYAAYVAAYQAGKPINVVLPLVGRLIPIVADDYSDPEKGSGAVKITPAHDFNDFEVGRRHDLPMMNVLSKEALILQEMQVFDSAGRAVDTKPSPQEFAGLERFAARKMIVAALEATALVEKIEPYTHTVPHGDRSGEVIEPFLTDQWYVDAKTLAQPALQAVRDGRTKFVPQNWEKTYFEWLENIQPWCISRQLWWGHQIPAWFGLRLPQDAGQGLRTFVATDEREMLEEARAYYGQDVEISIASAPTPGLSGPANRPAGVTLYQDEDVLDTWFSSALWPFSTLGWPDATPELARYYPTSVLVTGFDIIFFWVARMMMMGLHFMPDVPFRDVYIHALVRDEKGAKMSKSKGNVIDPLALIDELGADALRLTLAAMAAQGRDIKLARSRVEGYRNFATKLWNACRFAEINECTTVAGFDPATATLMLNRWIVGEAEKAAAETTAAIAAYRFNDAAAAVYRFVWSVFCDWYLELAKPVLQGGEGGADRDETRATVAWARDLILALLHPFMPFVTEELWAVTAPAEGRPALLALSPWPALGGLENAEAEAEIGWLVDLVSAIRSVRTETSVPAAAQIPLLLVGASAATRERAGRYDETIRRLARLSTVGFADQAPAGAVQMVVRGEVAALPIAEVVDLAAERTRLAKEIERIGADIDKIDRKLGNADFVARAPEEVVEEQQERRDEAAARRQKLEEALARLSAVSA